MLPVMCFLHGCPPLAVIITHSHTQTSVRRLMRSRHKTESQSGWGPVGWLKSTQAKSDPIGSKADLYHSPCFVEVLFPGGKGAWFGIERLLPPCHPYCQVGSFRLFSLIRGGGGGEGLLDVGMCLVKIHLSWKNVSLPNCCRNSTHDRSNSLGRLLQLFCNFYMVKELNCPILWENLLEQ